MLTERRYSYLFVCFIHLFIFNLLACFSGGIVSLSAGVFELDDTAVGQMGSLIVLDAVSNVSLVGSGQLTTSLLISGLRAVFQLSRSNHILFSNFSINMVYILNLIIYFLIYFAN